MNSQCTPWVSDPLPPVILEHTGIYRLCPPAALSYAYVGCSWPPRLYDGTSRSTQGWGNTQYFLFRKGISRFEQQVQHRDSGSWDKRYNQGLDRTAAFTGGKVPWKQVGTCQEH